MKPLIPLIALLLLALVGLGVDVGYEYVWPVMVRLRDDGERAERIEKKVDLFLEKFDKFAAKLDKLPFFRNVNGRLVPMSEAEVKALGNEEPR